MTAERPTWLGTVTGVLENVGVPIVSYLALLALGATQVWALAGSAGACVVVLVVDRWRGRPLSALGLLVLLRFALSLALAWLTGSPRVLLVKDSSITLVIACVALWSLTWRRPLIALIRRDLSADRAGFETALDTDPSLAELHRRLTIGWVAGLSIEATTSAAIALLAPITAAVVITNITGPAAILGLITWTEWSARRRPSAHQAPAPPPPQPTAH